MSRTTEVYRTIYRTSWMTAGALLLTVGCGGGVIRPVAATGQMGRNLGIDAQIVGRSAMLCHAKDAAETKPGMRPTGEYSSCTASGYG